MRTLEHINVKYFKYACDEIGKETPVDINAKCIICGDSDKDKRQKRLHLYTKANYDGDAIKCFNCEWTGNMFSFLREVDSSLFELYKKETREKSFNNLKRKHHEKKEYNDAAIQMGSYKRKARTESGTSKADGVYGSDSKTETGGSDESFSQNNGYSEGEIDETNSGRSGRDLQIHSGKEPQRLDENDGGQGVNVGRKRNYSFSMSGFAGANGVELEESGTTNAVSNEPIRESESGSNGTDNEHQTSDDKVKGLGKLPDDVFEMPDEFRPACESADAVGYLRGRGLDPEFYYYSPDWINFNGKSMPLKHAIIVPLWVLKDDNVMYGFQARHIDTKFFYTYIPEENTGFKVWNWYNIDKSKPTFIFESVFDAESSGLPQDRICAALGADLNDERLAELFEPIFCFDNQRYDETSRIKTVKLLKRGFRCFVWDKQIQYKDTNDAIQGGLPKPDMAKYILSHLETGMTGIIKTKLKR